MYRYDEFDAAFVAQRVDQFRDQVGRRVKGELTEEQFRPHRLMNGLYPPVARLYAPHRHPIWHAVVAPDA